MKKILFLFFLGANFNFIYSQPDLKFLRLTTEQGLLNDEVTSICQDHHGFIWFGTKKGASRFDGIEFKNYVHDENDSLSIGQGWVNKIIRDKNNNLWFALAGSTSTFMKYDDEKDIFIDISSSIRTKLHITDKNFSIWNLYIDNKGIIWLISSFGAIQYDPLKKEILDLTNSSHELKEISTTFIRDFYEDNNDNLWLASADGVYIYNYNSRLITKYLNNPEAPNSLSSNDCNCIYADSEKNIWIGTYNGLNRLSPASGGQYKLEVFNYDSENPHSISGHLVYDIEEDKDGNFLIATTNGLSLLDKKEQKIYRFYHSEIDNESINANIIRKIFRDMQGNLWFATSAGAAKLMQKNFRSYSSSSYKNSISHNRVQYLTEDGNSELWISTSKGIDIYNPKTGKFRFFAGITRNSDGLYGDPLVTSTNSNNKGMLIGTWRGGFSYYNYGTKKFHNYINDHLIDFENVLSLLFDSRNNFWICSNKYIYVYNQDTKKDVVFKHDKDNENSLSSNVIHFIIEDSESDIWIGTNNGLDLLADFTDGIFKHYLEGHEVLFITESPGSVFWLATDKGLCRFNKKTNEIKTYNKETGLPDASILGILEDESHNLWISTEIGISRLKFYEDSITEVVTYRKEEGVNIGNCLPRVCTKLVDGSMAFGGSKGFCMFWPETIKNDTLPPSVVFTDLTVLDKTIKPGDEINGQVPLQKSLSSTNNITLNHKNNAFVIGFVGIQYHLPQYIKYAYRLDGYDKSDEDWHYTDSKKRVVEYMNLPAGEYTFKVKAANSYGIWNDKPAVLLIDILPPWWKTLWFRILVIILIPTIIVSFYKYRVKALKHQKKVLEQKILERTQELMEANSQLEEKQEEILQQNEEIMTVNNQLKIKNTEIEISRNQLEKAFNNISIISEFGQKLTATFDFDAINKMIYEYVSSLMDTEAFGIGIYNKKRNVIDFPYFMEKGKPIPYFSKDLSNQRSLSVRCFKNSEEISINDLAEDYKKYLGELPEVQTSRLPSSIIHLPLTIENKPIGTITVNSYKKNAYTENDVANLRTLASYISIALDNSKAYRIIRSKNEQISGSIRYGQTIQQAMLPPKQQLDKYFENFVLFRPKDIVSGDFYWFASVQSLQGFDNGLDSDNSKNSVKNPQGLKNDYYFLAVVDCTGHGVPGAFMSMIGSRLLNDIVLERKIYSPAKILEQLNTMVRKALRQDITDNHDGMDVCLCCFQQNKTGWELTYSGAKRPLLFYNSQTGAIEEIRGTRRSIGGVAAKKNIYEFTETNLQIKKTDVFYLSTDGLMDQCNPKKRKFSQKRLIDHIQNTHNFPVNIQKEKLEKALDDFQDGFEQRDDITIIGIKIKK